MKFTSAFFVSLVALAKSASAVTLTFDSDTQGITNVSWNTNGGVAWSPNFGGSLAVTTNVAGWSNPVLNLNLLSPLTSPDFTAALTLGGTLEFDYTIRQADVTGYNGATPPGWFELVAIGNSDGAAGGGWDQNVLGGAAGYYGGIPAGPTTVHVVVGIQAGGPVENNGVVSFGAASGYKELMIGFNSESARFTSATVYLDNLRITPVPEPSAAVLGLGCFAGLLLRRRR